jgi:hypothetical protein
MPCSPAYAAILYPCDLTDTEWSQLPAFCAMKGAIYRG